MRVLTSAPWLATGSESTGLMYRTTTVFTEKVLARSRKPQAYDIIELYGSADPYIFARR